MNFKQFTKLTEMKLDANKKTVKDIQEMLISLQDNFEDGVDNIENALLLILEKRMNEKEYIAFLETL